MMNPHVDDRHGGADGRPRMSPAQAWDLLIAGHERFVRGEPRNGNMRREDFADLSRGQQPYATILGCSDSRVPPELIFDAGPGDLFVIRVAGNLLSPEVAGSLQYAGAHLETPLFVVLGHSNCGAVKAALESLLHGVQHLSRIQILVDSIVPSLEHVDRALPPQDALAAAVEANVRATMRAILESPEGQSRVRNGSRKLVGAIYDIASGRIRVLDQA
jgi:carbonic anhydrase